LNRIKRGRIYYKTIREKIKIQFNQNNFRFDKRNMQGERCMMMHDAPTIKEQTNLIKEDFSGPLQSTPPTMDLAPRSTLV
jgi:hypothetical protein